MLVVDLAPAQTPERWEASAILYDPAGRAFGVTVSRVKDEVKYLGTGGSSFGSPRKALP